MGAAYSFVSTWHLPVASDRSWAEIERMLRPGAPASWWPSLTIVEAPRVLAVGERMTLAVRSPFGYRLQAHLTITGIEPGRSLAASSAGDLRGSGRIEVDEAGDAASVVAFHWNVATERRWMNVTAFVLRPVFERAHTHVMREGERGLRAALGVP